MGKVRLDCSKDKPLTQQSAKDECDINLIIERIKRGADLPDLTNKAPKYGDFTQVPTDLRECLNIVRQADDLFMTLDAKVRARFENDPSQMLDFLNDSKNRDEAIELGLVEPPKAQVETPKAETQPETLVKKASTKAKPVEEA